MLKGKEGEANKGTNSREKSQPDEATVTLKHLNERSQVSEQGATFLTLSLQIGRAAQGTWSQVQGSERSQKYCPSYQVGKGKAVSLSIAPWHLGNGQAGLWLHLTHQPQHLSKGGREDSSSGCFNHSYNSELWCLKGSKLHCSRVAGSTVAAPPSSSGTPQPSQLTCPTLAGSISQSQAASHLPHESPYLAGMKKFSYLLL